MSGEAREIVERDTVKADTGREHDRFLPHDVPHYQCHDCEQDERRREFEAMILASL